MIGFKLRKLAKSQKKWEKMGVAEKWTESDQKFRIDTTKKKR